MFTPGMPSGVFDLDGVTVGASVCYDLRFPELFRRLALMGAELILVPAQWPEARQDLFRSFLRARAGEAQIFVAGCNWAESTLARDSTEAGQWRTPLEISWRVCRWMGTLRTMN